MTQRSRARHLINESLNFADMDNLKHPTPPRNHRQARQLELPLLYAPSIVKNHGLRAAHPRPLVSHGKSPGAPFTSFRTTPKKAWSFAELEYANAGSSTAALVVDCDDPDKMGYGLLDLPAPSWTVTRISNGHAHCAWTLEAPVYKYATARRDPQRYLATVSEFYAETVAADPGFTGLLCHNPAPRFCQDEFTTTWGREEPFTLDELANVIPFNWRPPRVRRTGVGRNSDLFEAGLKWAGRQANADTAAFTALHIANQGLDPRLDDPEIVAMARSIERYRARWAAHGWHSPRWIAKQAARGKAGGIKSGASKRAQGVQGPLRQSSEPGSNEELKPWEAEGISRRTWYRRRAKCVALIANTDKHCFGSVEPFGLCGT